MFKSLKLRNDVSVIVPTYNAGTVLIDALESIRMQTLQPAFVHVVDDMSSTDDASLACAYITEHQMKGWYVHRLNENQGAGGARDFGIGKSTTKYIAFLDADDLWFPYHLENAFSIIEKLDLTLFGGQTHKMSRDERVSSKFGEVSFTEISLNRLLFKCHFLTSTVVVHRSAYLSVGGFLQGQRLSEDYSLWLRIAANLNNRCAVTNLVHALYRDSDTTTTKRLSSNHWDHERAELANFGYLHNKKLIGTHQLVLSSVFSFLKYLRRLFVRR